MEFLTPAFVLALATLVTAVTSLVAVLRVQRTATDTHSTLQNVDKNTNGALLALHDDVARLTATQATADELLARRPDVSSS